MFIFLDEAGNFSGKGSSCFVIGGFITSDQKRTAKAFRKWQHRKFPKKIRRKNEVKFSDTGLNESLRLKTLSYFIKQDVRIFYSFLETKNIPLDYRNKRGLESGLLYAEAVVKTLRLLLPTDDLEFRVFRDARQLKKVPKSKFNKIVKAGLTPHLPAKVRFEIRSVDSASDTNIQIADWICGALYRYHCNTKNSEKYFLKLKNSIIAQDEMFKDHWLNENNKKPPRKR
ncbi:MAG: DUF3800 domain-containing protein [Parcubacteria group bacterium]|nr:DUF3800 domain-containing protein [Parcubacteria group bacterium]